MWNQTNSHLPFRKRERAMQGFRSPGALQRFVSIHSAIRNCFSVPACRRSALTIRYHRLEAFDAWNAVVSPVWISVSWLFQSKSVNVTTPINGIENFWNQAKRHMRKFTGIPKVQFGLYLKECEWRFNNSDPSSQLSQLRQWLRRHLRSLSGSAPYYNTVKPHTGINNMTPYELLTEYFGL